MSQLHTRIEVTMELLSPLHIGTGTELLLDYDVVPHGARTWRVDEEALLEQALLKAEAEGAAEVNRLLAGRPAAELLTEADFDPHSPLFRYMMPGTPFTRTPGAKVQEQIKDVHDRLYLPGSSLKGALRTVLAWGFYARQRKRPDLGRLKRSRSWAAQPLEQEIFGRDPNHDWLRALRVEDSQPLDPDGHMALRTVRIYPTATRDSSGLNVDVETVEPETVFQTAITVDEYGFQEEIARQLGWQGKRAWLGQLVTLGKEYARERLVTEATFFKAHGGPQATLRFYAALVKQVIEGELADDEFLLQVGWGTGWESKTLGSRLLRQDDAAFERLLNQYRMTKEGNRQPGDPFPRSRTLALRGGEPALPLGWVKVRLEGLEKMPRVRPEAIEKPQQAVVPAGQQTGHVVRFFDQRRFGFIKPDAGGEDIFVHVSDVTNADVLYEGQRVAYDVEIGDKGPRAVKVTVLS